MPKYERCKKNNKTKKIQSNKNKNEKNRSFSSFSANKSGFGDKNKNDGGNDKKKISFGNFTFNKPSVKPTGNTTFKVSATAVTPNKNNSSNNKSNETKTQKEKPGTSIEAEDDGAPIEVTFKPIITLEERETQTGEEQWTNIFDQLK